MMRASRGSTPVASRSKAASGPSCQYMFPAYASPGTPVSVPAIRRRPVCGSPGDGTLRGPVASPVPAVRPPGPVPSAVRHGHLRRGHGFVAGGVESPVGRRVGPARVRVPLGPQLERRVVDDHEVVGSVASPDAAVDLARRRRDQFDRHGTGVVRGRDIGRSTRRRCRSPGRCHREQRRRRTTRRRCRPPGGRRVGVCVGAQRKQGGEHSHDECRAESRACANHSILLWAVGVLGSDRGAARTHRRVDGSLSRPCVSIGLPLDHPVSEPSRSTPHDGEWGWTRLRPILR